MLVQPARFIPDLAMEALRRPTRRSLARVMLLVLTASLIVAEVGPFALAEEGAPSPKAQQIWFDDLQEPIELSDAMAAAWTHRAI